MDARVPAEQRLTDDSSSRATIARSVATRSEGDFRRGEPMLARLQTPNLGSVGAQVARLVERTREALQDGGQEPGLLRRLPGVLGNVKKHIYKAAPRGGTSGG